MGDGNDQVLLGPDETEHVRHRREALGIAGDWPLTGLALSGGGIRSATFSLGLIQGMAHGERLDRVDILSTVSGGGYIGAFLRSLFIPRLARFRERDADGAVIPATPADYRRRHDWALAVLKAPPAAQRLDGALADEDARHFAGWRADGDEPPPATANPVWWLREHGRYLTPNGSGDYLFAVAYIVRAWFAMQYVAIVPLLGVFLAFKIATAAGYLHAGETWGWTRDVIAWAILPERSLGVRFSPLMLLPLALLLVAVVPLSTSYWLTATATQWRFNRRKAVLVCLLLGAASVIAVALTVATPSGRTTDGFVRLGGYFTFVQIVAAIVLAVALARAGDPRSEIFSSEVRRVLTAWLATAGKAALLLLALAIVDSLALNIVHMLREHQATAAARAGGAGGIAALAVTTIVWLVQKVQAWLPRFAKMGRQASRLTRLLPGLILACGALAYGIMAVSCASLAYLLVWEGIPFESRLLLLPALPLLAMVVLLTLVTGLSPRFLNLSSLHYFYAGRLTRAYLGASNARRLAAFERPEARGRAGNVREYDDGDAICLADYHRKEVLAPVHLINVTVNETQQIDSQLIQRDRKGANLCVAPGGISLGGDWRSKADLAAQNAERLAVGKWMAISGAAASTGMGQATSLGTALLLTFANVRLGYWWYAPELAGRMTRARVDGNVALYRRGRPAPDHGPWRPRDLFETQSYLLNEASAQFSRSDRLRLNLSDGGHFENSAAYELIRRRLPLIIVSDAAADPGYDFEDFSNLARKARIDLGAELRCLDRAALAALPATVAPLCGLPEDFRCEQGRDLRCIVPCRIDYAGGGRPGLLILVKPRVPDCAPPDVAAYRRASKHFPQEPTADQFFGEAQWESYRQLGETIGRRLFPVAVDALMDLARSWRGRATGP